MNDRFSVFHVYDDHIKMVTDSLCFQNEVPAGVTFSEVSQEQYTDAKSLHTELQVQCQQRLASCINATHHI